MTSPEEFRRFGKAMIDYVADYLENIRDRRVLPAVKPGYLEQLIPDEAPMEPESWEAVFSDIERVIMPGVTHWHSPQFHAYFPTANSYPAIVADILSDAIGCIGFSWIASPACTELEMVMMNWLAKMLQLPNEFLFREGGKGGGVIQGTASEATLVAMLSARSKAIARHQKDHPELSQQEIMGKLVAYSSKVSHSSVERASLLGGVKMRLLNYDDAFSLRGVTLENAVREDRERGLIPFCVIATLGTTSCLSFDNLLELGPICQREELWLHIDAAYAGSAFICPEYRPILNGVEMADSFNFNPHKWMLVNFDCSAMWVKNASEIVDAFNVDPLYLKHDHQGQIPDYRHWHIPLGRRFRSLKLWFVLRLYGQRELCNYIRRQVALAHEFEALLENDDRFEITAPVGSNELNESLNKAINDEGRIHLTPSKVSGQYFLRMAVCSKYTNSDDITLAYDVIAKQAHKLLHPATKSVE